MNRAMSSCRICHREAGEDSLNIFEANMNVFKGRTISDMLHHFWGINYTRHELLPDQACGKCQELLLDEHDLRKGIQEREEALQQQLQEAVEIHPKYRPGLNGNPGAFVLKPGEELICVDPEQEYDSDFESPSDTTGDGDESSVEDEEGGQNGKDDAKKPVAQLPTAESCFLQMMMMMNLGHNIKK